MNNPNAQTENQAVSNNFFPQAQMYFDKGSRANSFFMGRSQQSVNTDFLNMQNSYFNEAKPNNLGQIAHISRPTFDIVEFAETVAQDKKKHRSRSLVFRSEYLSPNQDEIDQLKRQRRIKHKQEVLRKLADKDLPFSPPGSPVRVRERSLYNAHGDVRCNSVYNSLVDL